MQPQTWGGGWCRQHKWSALCAMEWSGQWLAIDKKGGRISIKPRPKEKVVIPNEKRSQLDVLAWKVKKVSYMLNLWPPWKHTVTFRWSNKKTMVKKEEKLNPPHTHTPDGNDSKVGHSFGKIGYGEWKTGKNSKSYPPSSYNNQPTARLVGRVSVMLPLAIGWENLTEKRKAC